MGSGLPSPLRAARYHSLAAAPDPGGSRRGAPGPEAMILEHDWDVVRRVMWDYVGIVRTNKRLERARHRVEMLQSEIAEYYGNYKVGNDLLELRNLAQVAALIIRSAQLRKESRGLHYTLDYPELDSAHPPGNTILTPDNYKPASSVASANRA